MPKTLDEIDNVRMKLQVEKAKYANVDQASCLCTINSFEIEDENERMWTAMELVKLNMNPEVIYLMKLSSSSINNCLLGLIGYSSPTADTLVIHGGARDTTLTAIDIWNK